MERGREDIRGGNREVIDNAALHGRHRGHRAAVAAAGIPLMTVAVRTRVVMMIVGITIVPGFVVIAAVGRAFDGGTRWLWRANYKLHMSATGAVDAAHQHDG